MGELAGEVHRTVSGRRVAIALGNALVFSVTGGPDAPRAARETLRERLGQKLDPEVVEIAEVLLSELVTNCVLHGVAAGPRSWIDITASIFPTSLWVEVCDGGPPFEHDPRLPALDEPSGRGLYIVDQLASRWGLGGEDAARPWFELPRSSLGLRPGGAQRAVSA
jgi:serine/threonine-protein kinase RsbW